jgi:hypothetical protein
MRAAGEATEDVGGVVEPAKPASVIEVEGLIA